MGTSWDVQPSFVQAALFAGVRYIDTSETYERGNAERTLGEVLERTGKRKDIYLVTKNSGSKIGGPGRMQAYLKRLNASLERLRTDYIDCYYLHGVGGREIALAQRSRRQGGVREAQEIGQDQVLRPECHDRRLPEIVTAAAESGWIDQIMIQYNYRTMTTDTVRRALDAAAKANLAIVAMKTQGARAASKRPTRPPSSRNSSTRDKKACRGDQDGLR